MKHGGKRKNAGRKPAIDKKQTVVLYIETSIINDMGGIETTKQKLYNFAKIEAGGEIIKTGNKAVPSINSSDKCNMHFVSICSRCEKKPKHKESIYCIDCLYERKMSGY